MQTFPIPVTLDLTALQEHNLVAGWENKFYAELWKRLTVETSQHGNVSKN